MDRALHLQSTCVMRDDEFWIREYVLGIEIPLRCSDLLEADVFCLVNHKLVIIVDVHDDVPSLQRPLTASCLFRCDIFGLNVLWIPSEALKGGLPVTICNSNANGFDSFREIFQ